MATLTSFLKLYKPVTNEIGWDDNMNSNLDILDGFINQFMNVPGFTGAWTNAHAYLVGQSALDIVSGLFYHCNVAHTSATTGLFSADRTAHPTFWTVTTSPAQDAANAAAASAAAAAASANTAAANATSAANSATAAANSAATAAGALLRTGGTMTGPLTLSRDPLGLLEASTKQYVDSKVGGAGFLPLTGGTLTGALVLNAAPISTSPVNTASTKGYVDTQVATRFPTVGGTINGAVTVAGNITAFNGNILARKDTGKSSVSVYDAATGVAAAMGFWFRAANQISFGNVDGNGIPGTEWAAMDATQFVYTFGVGTDNFGLVASGGLNGHRSVTFSSVCSLDMDNTNTTGKGNIQVNTAKGTIWAMRASDVFAFNSIGPVGGVGAFVNLSDVRFKENIVTATDNLAYIMSMRPVEFDWIATGKHDYGFISQEMATVMPTCVSPMGIELPDGSGGIDDANPTLGIGYTGIIPILVGAVQELASGTTPIVAKSPFTVHGDVGDVIIDVTEPAPGVPFVGIYSPDNSDASPSAAIWIASGNATGTGPSGELDLATGNSVSADTGGLYAYTGSVATSGNTGNVSVYSGDNAGIGNSGMVMVTSGDAPGGRSGDLLLKVGAGATQGLIRAQGLPTADPHVLNALWIDTAAGRVLKVSAG